MKSAAGEWKYSYDLDLFSRKALVRVYDEEEDDAVDRTDVFKF
jgi:hypothetical protein